MVLSRHKPTKGDTVWQPETPEEQERREAQLVEEGELARIEEKLEQVERGLVPWQEFEL